VLPANASVSPDALDGSGSLLLEEGLPVSIIMSDILEAINSGVCTADQSFSSMCLNLVEFGSSPSPVPATNLRLRIGSTELTDCVEDGERISCLLGPASEDSTAVDTGMNVGLFISLNNRDFSAIELARVSAYNFSAFAQDGIGSLMGGFTIAVETTVYGAEGLGSTAVLAELSVGEPGYDGSFVLSSSIDVADSGLPEIIAFSVPSLAGTRADDVCSLSFNSTEACESTWLTRRSECTAMSALPSCRGDTYIDCAFCPDLELQPCYRSSSAPSPGACFPSLEAMPLELVTGDAPLYMRLAGGLWRKLDAKAHFYDPVAVIESPPVPLTLSTVRLGTTDKTTTITMSGLSYILGYKPSIR
jgi:hypothetical protein